MEYIHYRNKYFAKTIKRKITPFGKQMSSTLNDIWHNF